VGAGAGEGTQQSQQVQFFVLFNPGLWIRIDSIRIHKFFNPDPQLKI
jgi:hypothetical protein